MNSITSTTSIRSAMSQSSVPRRQPAPPSTASNGTAISTSTSGRRNSSNLDDCITKALQHETTATLQGCDDKEAALGLDSLPFVGREREMEQLEDSVHRFLLLNKSNIGSSSGNMNGNCCANTHGNYNGHMNQQDSDDDENDTSCNNESTELQAQPAQAQAQQSTQELPPKIIAISGPAGSGKTALASQVESLLLNTPTSDNFFFLRGKFDEFTSSSEYAAGGEAYSGLAMAMEEFADQIVQRDTSGRMRQRIQDFVKGGESVLLDVFPGLRSVLYDNNTEEKEDNGPTQAPSQQAAQAANTTPAMREESREQRSKRRIFFFQQIFSAVLSLRQQHDGSTDANDACCVALVLDDVQWADQQSLDLISSLVRDPDLKSFLLITTNRPTTANNNKKRNQILDKQMKAWSSEKIRIQKIALDNLCVSSIETLVTSLLQIEEGDEVNDFQDTATKKKKKGEAPTTSLARAVHQKTDGNPFYAVEFLRALVDQQLLIYSYSFMTWKWDLDKIYAAEIMANTNEDEDDQIAGPLQLVIAKMKRLSQDQRLVLLVCSCLGGTIRPMLVRKILKHLREHSDKMSASTSALTEESSRQNNFSLSSTLRNRTSDIPALDTLEGFIRLGLMERHGKKLFVFVHDLIRQASMDFVSREDVEWMRLRVGECILWSIQQSSQDSLSDNPSKGNSEQHLFLAVDLCNGVSHLFDENESSSHSPNLLVKADLARHNFRAGEKAMKESLFLPALQYMKAGMKLLQPRQIEEANGKPHAMPDKELLVRLLAGAAEASYCSGNYEDMNTYAERLLREHDCEESVKLQMLYFKFLSAAAQELAHEALDIGYAALVRLGMATIPRYPKTHHVVMELLKTKRALKNHTAESLQQLPLLEDEKRIAAMEFLNVMKSSAAVSNQNLMICSFLKSVRWSVKYGLGKHSPGGFATYGMIINAMFQEEDAAIMYCDVALSLANRMDLKESFGETSMLAYGLNRHWTTEMRTCYAPLVYAQKLALEGGDIETVVLCLVFRQMIIWCTAMEPLSLMGKTIQRNCAMCRDFKNWSFLEMVSNFGLHMSRLVDDEDKIKYYGWLDGMDAMSSRGSLSGSTVSDSLKPSGRERAEKDPSIEILYDSLALQSFFLLGEREDALKYADLTYTVGTKMGLGTAYVTRTQFYRALVYLTHTQGKKKVPRKQLREATRSLSLLETWAKSGTNSCVHMVTLVKAEFARVRNDLKKAKELYASAIQQAESSGHIHDVAIGNERAAVFYLEYVNNNVQAEHHLEQSLLYFRKWGATAVVRYLLMRYGKSLSNVGTTSTFLSMQSTKS